MASWARAERSGRSLTAEIRTAVDEYLTADPQVRAKRKADCTRVAVTRHASVMRLLLGVCGLVVALFVVAPSPVSGQTPSAVVRYTVDITFDDGGTASGTFDFDPTISCVFLSCHTSGAFSNASITASAWGSVGTCDTQFPTPRTYTTGLSEVTESTRLAFSSPLNLWVTFDAPLGATGSVAVTTGALTSEFSGAGCTRNATAATASGVLLNPPPTTSTTTTTTTTTPESTTAPTTAPTTVAPTTTTGEALPTAPSTTIDSGGPSTELPATGSDLTAITALVAALLVGLGLIARRSAA